MFDPSSVAIETHQVLNNCLASLIVSIGLSPCRLSFHFNTAKKRLHQYCEVREKISMWARLFWKAENLLFIFTGLPKISYLHPGPRSTCLDVMIHVRSFLPWIIHFLCSVQTRFLVEHKADFSWSSAISRADWGAKESDRDRHLDVSGPKSYVFSQGHHVFRQAEYTAFLTKPFYRKNG